MDLVCLGELLVDMFPAELGTGLGYVSAFRPVPGGAPANVSVAAARLGLASAFIGKVGDDAFGRRLAEVLQGEGVDVRALRFDREACTTLAFIAQPDANTAEFLFYRNPGADMRLAADELDLDLLDSARAFHFGSISLIGEPSRSATLAAVRRTRAAGALISFDVNYRPSLWPSRQEAIEAIMATVPLADTVKVNDTELRLLSGSDDLEAGSAALLRLGPSLCVVTLGPDGSFFASGEGSGRVPGFAVKTVDATGCGDAFAAGLLRGLLADPCRGRPLAKASLGFGAPCLPAAPERLRAVLRYANAVGALKATRRGVIPALPRAAEVDEFLARSA